MVSAALFVNITFFSCAHQKMLSSQLSKMLFRSGCTGQYRSKLCNPSKSQIIMPVKDHRAPIIFNFIVKGIFIISF